MPLRKLFCLLRKNTGVTDEKAYIRSPDKSLVYVAQAELARLTSTGQGTVVRIVLPPDEGSFSILEPFPLYEVFLKDREPCRERIEARKRLFEGEKLNVSENIPLPGLTP